MYLTSIFQFRSSGFFINEKIAFIFKCQDLGDIKYYTHSSHRLTQ